MQKNQQWKNTHIRAGNVKTRHTREFVGGNRRTDKTRFEVFTAALLRFLPFWDVMLCHYTSDCDILKDSSPSIFKCK